MAKCKTCGTNTAEKAKIWVLGGEACPTCKRIPFKEPKPKKSKKK